MAITALCSEGLRGILVQKICHALVDDLSCNREANSVNLSPLRRRRVILVRTPSSRAIVELLTERIIAATSSKMVSFVRFLVALEHDAATIVADIICSKGTDFDRTFDTKAGQVLDHCIHAGKDGREPVSVWRSLQDALKSSKSI